MYVYKTKQKIAKRKRQLEIGSWKKDTKGKVTKHERFFLFVENIVL